MDANLKFVTVGVGACDKQRDGEVFRNSALYQRLEPRSLQVSEDRVLSHGEITLTHIFGGDEAYLLTRTLDSSKAVFNCRLSLPRRVVESAFGICASKWRILEKTIETKVDTGVEIVKYLHNIVID